MPSSGPASAAASSGTICPIAATTRDATGSHSWDQAGSVRSTHSTRDHDSMPVTPEGSGVTGSSQWSASRTASAICERSTGVGAWCAAASAETAICLARSQFTGPLCWDSICCSAANSGALPARSSGMPPPGKPKPGPIGRSPDPDEPEPDEPSGSSRCGPNPNPNGTSVTSGLLALPCSPR